MRHAQTADGKPVLVRIPAGQSLELVATIAGLFGAILPGCLMSKGDEHGTAADIIGGDVTEQQIIRDLRRATRKLNKNGRPDPIPADEADDTFADDPMVLNRMRGTDTGVEFGIGGATEASRELAAHLLSVFIPALQEQGAENYLTWDALHPETGDRYSVIFVKPGGLTPHEARQRAERELDTAIDLLDSLIDDEPCRLDHHGYCQEHSWFNESECAVARARRVVEQRQHMNETPKDSDDD